MPVIIAKNGPNKGKIFHITESIITIGRDDSQTIKVFDQGISRQHSEIFRIGEMCFIRDLNSTNGTYLNGKKVTEEMLRMGDEITVGNTVLAFEDKSSSAILRTMPNVDFDSNERIDTTTIEINVSKKKPTGEKPIIVGNEIASRNIDVLYKISKLITSESDLHTMLHKTVECIIDVFGAANGYIFLVDSKNNKVEPRIVVEHETGADKKVSRTIIKHVMQTSKSIMTGDAISDDRFSLSESIVIKKIKSVICAPIITEDKVRGLLYITSGSKSNIFTSDDLELITSIGLQLGIVLSTVSAKEDAQKLMVGIVKTLVTATEIADPKSQGHAKRVADYSTAIAIEMELSRSDIHNIRLSALLHDIGKIAVHNTGSGNTDSEHIYVGEKLISSMDGFEKILPGIKYHHERADGSGYPYKLKNADTPLMAKIIIVANAFDNMCALSGMKGEGLPVKDVLLDMGKRGGSEFDDDIIKALLITHRNGTLYNPPEIFGE